MLSELPFFTLDHQDFLKVTSTWVNESSRNLLESKDVFEDIIISPEREDELFENPFNNYIQSNYHTIKQAGNFIHNVKKNRGLPLMHFNMRNMTKNLTFFEDMILTMKSPEIIAIPETKLHEGNVNNISIPGYVFLNVNSPTNAGGVGLYVSRQLDFIRRRDLEFSNNGIESCWVEISREKRKNIVVGVALKEQLSNLNSKGKEVFVLSDININLLNYNSDDQTSDYVDMLLDLDYMPLITTANRVTDHNATLIDHIYTNVLHKVTKAGMCLVDITYHLPVFCTVTTRLSQHQEAKYFRDFSHFADDLFLRDLQAIHFWNLLSKDVNVSMNNVINAL